MRLPSSIAAVAIALMAANPAVSAQDHAQHHAPAAKPDAATARYPTDAPLRQGMQDIRAAVDRLAHYERGHMTPKEATRLAGEIEGHVRFIIANCKLPPQADAALHAIIVPLMQNAGTLRKDPMKRETIAAMREALLDYARQFDDPGNVQPAEPEEAR